MVQGFGLGLGLGIVLGLVFRFNDTQRHSSAVVHRCVFYMDPASDNTTCVASQNKLARLEVLRTK